MPYPARCFAILLTLLVALPAGAAEVTVMAYNVENMFDVYDDPYTEDEGTDVKRRDEVKAIAAAIAKAKPDIVVFQELENEHMLQGMVDTFLPGAGYAYVACQRTNSGRGINLGVISKLPIKRLASYRFRTLTHPDVDPAEQTWRFARDVMHVTVDVDGQDLHLLNVHLKSNSSRENDPNSMKWRTAEALELKAIFRGLVADDPGALVLALGDFNSNFETRPEQPRPWPATQAIREPEPDGTRLMNDAHDALAFDQRITIPGSGRYPPAVFDYIYASPALHKTLVKDSPGILSEEALTAGSDHYPLYATYDIGE